MADHTSRTSSIYSAQNDRRTSVRSNQRSAWHSQVPLKGLTKRAMRMETDLRNPQPFETLPPLQQPASGLRAFICASISRGVAKQPEEPLKLHSLRQALRLSPFSPKSIKAVPFFRFSSHFSVYTSSRSRFADQDVTPSAVMRTLLHCGMETPSLTNTSYTPAGRDVS